MNKNGKLFIFLICIILIIVVLVIILSSSKDNSNTINQTNTIPTALDERILAALDRTASSLQRANFNLTQKSKIHFNELNLDGFSYTVNQSTLELYIATNTIQVNKLLDTSSQTITRNGLKTSAYYQDNILYLSDDTSLLGQIKNIYSPQTTPEVVETTPTPSEGTGEAQQAPIPPTDETDPSEVP